MQLASARVDQFMDVAFWRRASVRITVALSAALLMLGLVLPDRFAAPMIGVGLTGILAVRLLAMGTGRSLHGRHSAGEARDDDAATNRVDHPSAAPSPRESAPPSRKPPARSTRMACA